MLFISRFTKTPNIEKLSFDSTVIEITERGRDLGFILDKNRTMTYHTKRDMQKSNQCNQVHRAHSQIEKLSIKFTSNIPISEILFLSYEKHYFLAFYLFKFISYIYLFLLILSEILYRFLFNYFFNSIALLLYINHNPYKMTSKRIVTFKCAHKSLNFYY